jgi:23S rRNA-/tRNA-specific pseudouridylate synthase
MVNSHLVLASLMLLLLQRHAHAWSTLVRRHQPMMASRLFSWQGVSHSSSEFVTHVIAGSNEPTVEEAITANLHQPLVESDPIPLGSKMLLSARDLLELGAVWYLEESAPRDPSMGQKPQRLSLKDAAQVLQENDYLRIHHTPRRFLNVHNYDWTGWNSEPGGVVVARGDGFWVIDKPANVPVHPTVDNALENVAEQVRIQLPEDSYVSTPQRLDQNTSGLFVVARSKAFAGYFAKLLRTKTDNLLKSDTQDTKRESIQKGYKCLLCLIPKDGSSMAERYQHLSSFDVLQHYLEPSIRAPKHFSRTQGNETWAESLLRVTSVGEAYPLIGSTAADNLASSLFNVGALPDSCVGVVEVHVELLTGRTHQIRGQFSAEGYPLVGDAQYGGAIPTSPETGDEPDKRYTHSERLALQCSYLKFLDPDVVTNVRGDVNLLPSDRWNEYKLSDSWWAPLLEAYAEDSLGSEATTNMEDMKNTMLTSKEETASMTSRQDLLPPRVALSPGANKYVIIKATNPDGEALWFVKSALPDECGGPYHANVAKDVVEWLEAMDFSVDVTGGGRIDYNPTKKYANVYGFSYGFGKGDHAKVASLIEEHTGVFATYDNSASLY